MLRLRALSRRQRALLFGGVGVVILALLAGGLSLANSSSDSDAEADDAKAIQRDLKPFREAVEDLADAPGLRYEDTSAFGITENEITVTAGGSQFGTTSSGGRDADTGRDVLRIGDRTFLRWKVDPAPEQDVEAGEKAPPSEWMVGLDDGSELTDEALTRTLPPAKLAEVLNKALADLEKSPPPAEGSQRPGASAPSQQKPLNVNGKPALGVDTSAGRLLVTKDKPHQVLRLEPYDLRENLDDMREQWENGETPTAPRRVTTGPLADGDSDGMDLAPILADAADKMFDTLVEYTEQLKDATDHGINFTLDGSGNMNCSSAGCTATQRFTGQVSSKASEERVTDGKVTAVMSATFTIAGRPAGQCTSGAQTFPVNGTSVSGSLSCANPGAGAVFTAVDNQYRRQAEAQSRARGGRPVPYTIPLRASTLIDAKALASVEVEKLVDQAERERDSALCAKPHSFPSGTQVLLADGTARAIEDVRIGDRVAATDPERALTSGQSVTRTYTTEGDKDFTRITVTTDQGPATVTATDNHPFWDVDDQRWKDAGDLRVGDALRAPNGSRVPVTAVADQTGAQRTHDLTVNGVHTYYVLADDAPVLVHNQNDLDYAQCGFPGQAHTLDEHVNVSADKMRQLAQKKGINSKWADKQTAQEAVDAALAHHQQFIARRLAKLREGETLSLPAYTFRDKKSLGAYLKKDGSSGPTGNRVRVVIQKAKKDAAGKKVPGGYYVYTAYPE